MLSDGYRNCQVFKKTYISSLACDPDFFHESAGRVGNGGKWCKGKEREVEEGQTVCPMDIQFAPPCPGDWLEERALSAMTF